mmetsp:Transcript_30003/g.50195  ORF Transcript_30003/g.50195 Transcript_30003/m.50195 type:complete len:163 (-) Transcript_30003:74-562(-)
MFMVTRNAAFLTHQVCKLTRAVSTDILKPSHAKHRVPQKKASKLLNILKKEEFVRLKNGREFPEIKAGDSVVIEKLPYMSAKEPDIIKGLVIAKTNRASDTALRILNVEYGTPIQRRIVMYSPLIKSIKVLQRAFIHKGRKRVRRSKLYYLLDRHPDNYTVK